MSAHNTLDANYFLKDLKDFETGIVTDSGGNQYKIDEDGSFVLPDGSKIKPDDTNYNKLIEDIIKSEDKRRRDFYGADRPEFDFTPIEVPPPTSMDGSETFLDALTKDDDKNTAGDFSASSVADRQKDIDKDLSEAVAIANKPEVELAKQKALQDKQQDRNLAGLTIAGVAGALQLASTFIPTATDKYIKEGIEKTREELEKPLVSGEQMAIIQEQSKQEAAKIGALAREELLKAEALAGGETSAAERTRRARESSRRVDRGLDTVAARQGGRLAGAMERGLLTKERLQSRLDRLVGAKGARQAQKIRQANAFVDQLSKVTGDIYAQGGIESPESQIDALFKQAASDQVLLTNTQANAIVDAINQKTRFGRSITEEELQDILREVDPKLTASDSLINSLTGVG